MLDLHRELYNAAIEERRQAWKRKRITIDWYAQNAQLKAIRLERDDIASLNFSSCQITLRRVHRTFVSFFVHRNSRKRIGYPRFKSKKRFNSICFTFGDGIGISSERIRVTAVGKIRIKWHRPIPTDAKIKEAILKRRADGWYVYFQLELPDYCPPRHSGEPVGIDLGLSNIVALSNGETVEAKQHLRIAEKKLRTQQRRLSRRRKGSARWRKAARLVSKSYKHVADTRLNFNHQLSTRLARTYSLIAVEGLDLLRLGKGRFSKSIGDVAWGQLIRQIGYKVENTGSQMIKVDPRYTSQVCSGCGCIVKKDLSVRVHSCPECGLVLDRDVNAARNILKRALDSARTEPSDDNVARTFASVV